MIRRSRASEPTESPTFRCFLALDDEILLFGLGPKKAEKLKALGERSSGPRQGFESLLHKAQRRVERRHFRDRKILLYHEKKRQKVQKQMGQDPYLDTPG